MTAAQFFTPAHHGLEFARVLVVSVGETSRISGGINANFNSTIRLTGGAKVVRCHFCCAVLRCCASKQASKHVCAAAAMGANTTRDWRSTQPLSPAHAILLGPP